MPPITFNPFTGKFDFLGETTETDPVVGAINGIVKANGSGTIAAAVAGTDYQAPVTQGTTNVTWLERAVTNTAISFGKTFSSTPKVLATLLYDGSYPPAFAFVSGAYYVTYSVEWSIESKSTTGFSFQIRSGAGSGGSGSVDWVAFP